MMLEPINPPLFESFLTLKFFISYEAAKLVLDWNRTLLFFSKIDEILSEMMLENFYENEI